MRQFFTAFPYIPPADPEPLIALYRKHGTRRHVKRGEIIKYADETNRLYYVEDGVCAYHSESATRPIITFLLPPGRTLGDISALGRRHYNIEWCAVTDGIIYVVPPSVLQNVIFNNPHLALEKIKQLISKEEASLEGLTANVTLESDIRLKILLKALIRTMDPDPGNTWFKVPYRLSEETLGLVINLSRTNVSRILSRWTQAGLAKRENGDLRVHKNLFIGLTDWMKDRH